MWRPQILALAAEAALQRGQLKSAARLLEERFKGVDLSATTPSTREAHDTAYRTFMKLGRANEALAHLVALKRLDDAATKLATTTSTALMGARFDFANQELRIARLRAEDLRRSVEAEQAKARFQRTIFVIAAAAVAAIIALLGWLLFTIRRSRDRVRAANDDLALTNAALGKALAAKTEFLATTSHEIRTPLNGILGMTQVMLADPGLDVGVRERLGIVQTAGTTMRALVDDILDVAKMETGNLTVEQAPFDLCATLKAAVQLWEVQCRAKGLSFEATFEGCPALIVGDAARLRQVVFNLLGNAVKFTAEGGIRLRASADRETGMVAIAVTDTGIGIPPDQQTAIFEAFRQADTSTTRRFGGTGLGLSICRNLAEAMGGRVDVASVCGEGSTFTLTLPLVEPEGQSAAVAPSSEPTRPILVLDRSPIVRAMWRSLLGSGRTGFAGSADEAVERLATGVERVLLDDRTVGTELSVLAPLLARAHAVSARVVLLWPTDRSEDLAALAAMGVDQVVLRPFAPGVVLEALGLAGVSEPLVPEAA